MVNKVNVNYATHPGIILKRYLKNLEMSQIALAGQTGINKVVISDIIKGKRNITTNIALKLESVFEMPAKFWIGLQSDYDEAIARLRNNVVNKMQYKSEATITQETIKKVQIEEKQKLISLAV